MRLWRSSMILHSTLRLFMTIDLGLFASVLVRLLFVGRCYLLFQDTQSTNDTPLLFSFHFLLSLYEASTAGYDVILALLILTSSKGNCATIVHILPNYIDSGLLSRETVTLMYLYIPASSGQTQDFPLYTPYLCRNTWR